MILPLNHGAPFYFEPGFYRDPRDEGENQSVDKLFLETSSRLIARGAFFDRPYPLWAQEVCTRASRYRSKIQEIKKMRDL